MKFRALSSVIRDIIFQRRFQNRNEDDFLSMLMEARDTETGKGMTDKELVDEIMTLIVAGHETTASALNWLWYLLFNHPPAYDKVKKEVDTLQGELPGFHHLSQLSYTKQVIDETLRLYPPGWLLTRRAISDDQIGPYFIPAKTDILISPFVVHRHPAFWNDPDQFDPARFGADQKKERNRFEYFPFAGGPRQCIGDFFAQVEMQLHIALVTQRFELQLIAPDTITLDAQINLRAREPFYATLNPRP
jgi:cytochrome P450